MKSLAVIIFFGFFFSSISASAASFWKNDATITKVLAGNSYGGCMILLDTNVGNGCSGKWVSLDCEGLKVKNGALRWGLALNAANSGKKVNVQIYDDKTIGGYCVGRRVDVKY